MLPANVPPISNFEDVRQILGQLLTTLNTVIGALPSPTNLKGQRITNVGNPVSGQDAANKDYVDRSSGGGGGSTGNGPILPINIIPKSSGNSSFVASSLTDNGTGVLGTEYLDIAAMIRSNSNASFPSTGAGLELTYTGGVAYVQGYDRSGGVYKALQLTGNTVKVIGGGGSLVYIQPGGGNCSFNASAGNYPVDVTGDANVSGVYRVGGTPGVGNSITVGNSVTVNTAGNGVFGTPGSGQSNGTVVTSVTLNTSVMTFTGGIRTA